MQCSDPYIGNYHIYLIQLNIIERPIQLYVYVTSHMNITCNVDSNRNTFECTVHQHLNGEYVNDQYIFTQ